jgi:hypothetical protein
MYEKLLDSDARVRQRRGHSPSTPWGSSADATRVPIRIGEFGPLRYQNDDVLLARLGEERYARIKLLNAEATPPPAFQEQADLYAYEITNFVNGKRSVGEIRDAVSAEFGPIPLEIVSDYLSACAEAKIIHWK